MLMIPIVLAFVFPVTVPDATAAVEVRPAIVLDSHITPSAHQNIAPSAPVLLGMGPDPGSKTGATVNSDTVKTGQPTVDTAANPNSSNAGNAAGGADRGNA